jgi:hypothetical protein
MSPLNTRGGGLPVGVPRQSVADCGQQRHHEVSSRPEERVAHEPNRRMDENHPEPLADLLRTLCEEHKKSGS